MIIVIYYNINLSYKINKNLINVEYIFNSFILFFYTALCIVGTFITNITLNILFGRIIFVNG